MSDSDAVGASAAASSGQRFALGDDVACFTASAVAAVAAGQQHRHQRHRSATVAGTSIEDVIVVTSV